jgi:hypothetical protein
MLKTKPGSLFPLFLSARFLAITPIPYKKDKNARGKVNILNPFAS